MTQVSNATAPDRATEGLVPFHARVADTMMIDKTQARMFACLGRGRNLFRSIDRWPRLEDALAERSATYLEQVGEARWESAGGVYGPDGSPTCRPTSLLADGLVRELAADPGGLLWTDNQGVAWAVRLVPEGSEAGTFFGFAVSWQDGGGLPDDGIADGGQTRKNAVVVRARLERQARRLRLAARAEQLLWAIHWAVLTQHRSVVLLPDVLLGQLVWGGDKDRWPQDWRGDLLQTLRSLTHLRSEVLRLSSEGWCPRLGMHSVAVAAVEALWVTRPDEDRCRPSCPMWNSARPHRPLAVQAGYGFLGAMEKFASAEGPGYRDYDFRRIPDDEAGEELRSAVGEGRLVSVNAAAALFAPSKWSGLSDAHHRIIQALSAEVTRPPTGRKSGRPDGAQVIRGNEVTGTTPRSRTVCPELRPGGRYVAFCGNGIRWGMGYGVVGTVGTGWLHKCGYDVPQDIGELAGAVRVFFDDLGTVAEVLGLTAVGLGPDGGWLGLSEMAALARSRGGLAQLLGVQLRVYGPEDYLRRCRDFFKHRGGFAAIPGGNADRPNPSDPPQTQDLSAQGDCTSTFI